MIAYSTWWDKIVYCFSQFLWPLMNSFDKTKAAIFYAEFSQINYFKMIRWHKCVGCSHESARNWRKWDFWCAKQLKSLDSSGALAAPGPQLLSFSTSEIINFYPWTLEPSVNHDYLCPRCGLLRCVVNRKGVWDWAWRGDVSMAYLPLSLVSYLSRPLPKRSSCLLAMPSWR